MQINSERKRIVTANAAHQAAALTAAERQRVSLVAMDAPIERGKLTPERIVKLLQAMDARSLAKRQRAEN